MQKRRMNEDKELGKCNSVEEAVKYLRAKETNSKLSLKTYRKFSKTIDVHSLVDVMIAIVIGVVMAQVMQEVLNGEKTTY